MITSNYLKKLCEKHNSKVNKAFNRAKAGEIINLTDLMISQEKVYEKLMQASCQNKGGAK